MKVLAKLLQYTFAKAGKNKLIQTNLNRWPETEILRCEG